VPREGFYREVFNSDSSHYAGSNLGNFPGKKSEPIPGQGRPHSIEMTLPPLGVVVLKPE
jgi:1,4-alpha-glucan branching enzyme